jgi:hypothetical protein
MTMEIRKHREDIPQGSKLLLRAVEGPPADNNQYTWTLLSATDQSPLTVLADQTTLSIDTRSLPPDVYEVRVDAKPKVGFQGDSQSAVTAFSVSPPLITQEFVEGMVDRLNVDRTRTVRVSLTPRKAGDLDDDGNLALWQAILNRTEAISFRQYREFIDRVLCPPDGLSPDEAAVQNRLEARRELTVSELHGVDAYHLLRAATEAFLVLNAGVFVQPPLNRRGQPGSANMVPPGDSFRVERPRTLAEIQAILNSYLGDRRLPYLSRVLATLGTDRLVGPGYPECVIDDGFRRPLFLELIWSYWHEEGMLVQSINALSLRFQNRRGAADRDPLAILETDPLRPLNNLLWGYIQDEYQRLTVPRRANEYAHEYGLPLYGKAVPEMRVADNRSQFVEAFHNLLYLATVFYKQSDDTTVNADPFPLYNALREVHLILAQGAHNQFGDLPWTARVEMLINQWLLARRETSEFLRGRYMVPYEEEWMGAVDTMKTLQGWTDTTVSQFHRLARFGEQLLLSIRYTDWIEPEVFAEHARAWALFFRSEIQAYIHAYRAVTGVDLAADATSSQPTELRYKLPSELLRQRLIEGRSVPDGRATPLLTSQPADQTASLHPGFRERKALRK